MANAQYDQKVYIRKKIENKIKRDQEKAMEVYLMSFEEGKQRDNTSSSRKRDNASCWASMAKIRKERKIQNPDIDNHQQHLFSLFLVLVKKNY